jgi:hypothetical protein
MSELTMSMRRSTGRRRAGKQIESTITSKGVIPRNALRFPAERLGCQWCGATILLRRLRPGAVFLDPGAAKLDRFLRGQPGPVGAAGAQGDPDGIAMYVFFNGDKGRVRHDLTLSARNS